MISAMELWKTSERMDIAAYITCIFGTISDFKIYSFILINYLYTVCNYLFIIIILFFNDKILNTNTHQTMIKALFIILVIVIHQIITQGLNVY